MSSLKELRMRIKSVKNTQQITKTMKMVAAAKVRRARESCENARPFADRLSSVLVTLARRMDRMGAPLLLAGREDARVVRLLVFGSDRGLCGGFNGQLVKQVTMRVKELQKEGKKVQIVTLGRKVKDSLKSLYPQLMAETFDGATNFISYPAAEEIGAKMLDAFEKGECDQIEMFYNVFVSMMTQKPTHTQLVPFRVEDDDAEEGWPPPSVEYEPEEDEILEKLLPYNVNMQIFRAMLESSASEQAARMMAMDNATRNAGDMIKGLSLKYNRSRQAMITKELIEIISGAEAV